MPEAPAFERPGANPLWGDGWPSVRDLWTLDPEVTFLNHGSYGATPRQVLDSQLALRIEMERDPVAFFVRRLPDLLRSARERVADSLGADPDGFAFVPNATTGASTVLASLDLRPGDRLVTTDHAYGAVRNTMARSAERSGAEVVEVHLPLPPLSDEGVVATVMNAVDERTRLVVIDHVTSPTALILPVEAVVAACRERGVPVLVDAAHAPGMVPVDVGVLGADFWTGNLHKWACAPKGAAALIVAPEYRERFHPLLTSHGYGQGFAREFDWTGTSDQTPYLAAPAALDLLGGLGWERLWAHNHALAVYGRDVVTEALGTDPLVPQDRFGSMGLAALPDGAVDGPEGASALEDRLFFEHRIEVPLIWWDERAFVRMSAQAYNAPAEYERLASALASST